MGEASRPHQHFLFTHMGCVRLDDPLSQLDDPFLPMILMIINYWWTNELSLSLHDYLHMSTLGIISYYIALISAHPFKNENYFY